MRIVNRNQQQTTTENRQIVGSGCKGCGECGGTNSPNCLTCTQGGNKCLDPETDRVIETPMQQPYSNLGGVIAPINSAYVMPSMSNPNAERPVKPLSTQIPSQTNLGGIADIQDFNPYNNLGTYKNQVNTMQNDQRLPKKFGGEFFTNVNLENPSGSPVLKATGVDYGGYLPPTMGGVGKAKGCRGTCKISQGAFRRRVKVPCVSCGDHCCCSHAGTSIKCGRDARSVGQISTERIR